MHRTSRRALMTAGAAAVTALGLAVRPPPFPPLNPDRALSLVGLRTDLPSLLRNHLDPDNDGAAPRIDTVATWSRGRMRVGPSPWLPLRYRSLLGVGEAFVTDLGVTWYGRTVVPGVDAYVDGHGLTRIGPKTIVGAEIDQGANFALWAGSSLVPSAFSADSRVDVTQEDPTTLRLEFPGRSLPGPLGAEHSSGIKFPLGSGTDQAWLRFDGDRPQRLSGLRHKTVGAPKQWWHVDYGDWRQTQGIWWPGRMEVTWEEEGRPLAAPRPGSLRRERRHRRSPGSGSAPAGARAMIVTCGCSTGVGPLRTRGWHRPAIVTAGVWQPATPYRS